MMKSHFLSCITCTLAILFLTNCQERKTEPNPDLLNIKLLRGDIISCGGDEFGEVNFPYACNPTGKEDFELAISLLHSFEYDEAEKAFVKVIDKDPNCAMAYWGIAMSIYHTLWAPPTPEEMKRAQSILKIAETVTKTDREEAYLDAIGAYYTDWENSPPSKRASDMARKMEAIYQQYPDDTEAAVLYALTLNATADPTDKAYANQRKAGQILESLFPGQPNHPGIAHYIIHNYDNPVLAPNALETARKYAEIAPASAHAQHMPSHIFIRLGLWDEAIKSNLEAKESAICYAEQSGIEGHWDEELHTIDYAVYGYLQKGDDQKALEQKDYLYSIQNVSPVNFKVSYAFASIPARIALEKRDWQSAASLQLAPFNIQWQQFPWQRAIVHFTRAFGAAHLQDIEHAEKEIDTLQSLHQQLLDRKLAYEANQVLIQQKAAQAWLLQAQGKNEEAIKLMREAADMEDSTEKHPVTPCEVLPARELLADMYLAQNKAHEALVEYQKDLEVHPSRLNGLYGAALAAQKLGMTAEAKDYFDKMIALTNGVKSPRAELILGSKK